jgi:subtilase family serine protease
MYNNGITGNRTAGFVAVLIACLLILFSFAAVDNILSSAEPQADEMIFHPMSIAHPAASYGFSGYSVNQIRTAYGLPATGGAGVTIAIIIAYDTPSIREDLKQFSIANNLPLPDDQNFEVHKMSSTIKVDSSWSQEACLDVEWAHAIAPDAKILLVESVNEYSSNLFAAIQYATNRPDVSVVSMSWGSNEARSETANDFYFSDSERRFLCSFRR